MLESTGSLPEKGSSWEEVREALVHAGRDDIDWRDARTAVYVFNPGEDVMQVVVSIPLTVSCPSSSATEIACTPIARRL